jgi:hypothetical protein
MSKDKTAKVRVSREEYRRWSKEAQNHGITVAEWVRRRCQDSPDERKGHRGYAAIQCRDGEIVQVWSVPLQSWVMVEG